MALALAREGAKLALVDLDGEELQQVVGEVQDIGGRESVILSAPTYAIQTARPPQFSTL